jgi:hypothetical protein
MILASYHTNPHYHRFGDRMMASAGKLGLDCILAHMPDRGAWNLNVQHKPDFLLDVMKANPWHDGVAWIDCDAIVHKKPELLMNEPLFDVACYQDGAVIYGALLYFRNNDIGKKALLNWSEQTKRNPGTENRLNFMAAIRALPEVKLNNKLPAEYCYVKRFHPQVTEPVIESLMISRMTPKMQEELLK